MSKTEGLLLARAITRAAAVVSLGALIAAVPMSPPEATAQAADSEPRRCVSLRRVDHTNIVSDQTILFYMRDGDVLRNDLPNRCPTLMSEDTFMYRAALDQLCSIDTITVLDDIGFGFMPGPTCMLGEFRPITEEEGEALEREAEQR